MRRLLIVDASEVRREAVSHAFAGKYEIAQCGDGNEVMEMFRTFRPDVLIMDLALPHVDGLTLLREAGDARPALILAIAPFPSDYTYHSLCSLNVQTVVLRGISVSAIVGHIQEMEAMAAEQSPKAFSPLTLAQEDLDILGFDPDLCGYAPLNVSIPLFAQDPRQSVCKELYAEVARQCFDGAGNSKQVERAIRKSIENAWEHRDPAVWASYHLERTKDGKPAAPTNKRFIAWLARRLNDKLA